MFALFHPLGVSLFDQFIPAMFCLVFFAKLWREGELWGVQRAAFVAWFVTALATQLASRGPWTWIAGFVGQIALAVVLVLKDQIDNIF